MELKQGNQTSTCPRAEASAKVTRVLQPLDRGRSTTESIHEDPDQIENSRISHDASSLSSDSTSVEFIRVNRNISPSHHGFAPVQKPGREKENAVSIAALSNLEDYFGPSSSSTSRISSVTHESDIPNMSSTRQPPIQVMERTAGFDSNRIPASVFGKPTTIMDWSLASNESLFSIQIGKGSFSIEQAVILDLDHSEEFSLHEGSYSFKDFNQSGSFESDKLYESKEVNESGELGICRESIVKEKEEKPQNFGSGNTQFSEEPMANTNYRSINGDFKKKIEGIGNGNTNETHSKQMKSSNSLCANCCCPSFNCCKRSCCCCQRPDCSCKCISCPTCTHESWSGCSCKTCCWLDCSCKRSCCLDCSLKWPSLSSCCCKWQRCCCKPSTWECCSCRCPKWSIKKILCCLPSKSSTEVAG